MTFQPLQYFGYFEATFRRYGFSLGWQGIVPANAAKMAGKAVTLMTTKLIRIGDVFDRIDPARINELIAPQLQRSIAAVLREVAPAHLPDLWESLPVIAQEEIALAVGERTPKVIVAVIEALKDQIEECVDLKQHVVDALLADKALLNEIFERCGERELRFIERSGYYFGFLLGVVQMGIMLVLQEVLAMNPWWFLPLAGAVCGTVTNWIALMLIFTPIEPVTYCWITMHGLFLRRQAEVSLEFAKITQARTLTAEQLWRHILHGPRRKHFERVITLELTRAVDSELGMLRALLPATIGTREYREIKAHLARAFISELPAVMPLTYAYCDEVMATEELIGTKMAALPYGDFEGLLHPVFEEDEWKLIAVGGLLGMLVGVFQAAFVFDLFGGETAVGLPSPPPPIPLVP